MTIGNLKERLIRLTNDVLHYQTLYAQFLRLENDPSRSEHASRLEACREKLLQEYRQLADPISVLSQGPYRIGIQTGGLTDVYLRAFSAHCEPWQLDFIIDDLGRMVTALASRSPDECLRQPPVRAYMQIGTLGNQTIGVSAKEEKSIKSATPSSLTVKELLIQLSEFFHQRVTRPEDQATIHNHLQAILHHPATAPFLSTPISDLL